MANCCHKPSLKIGCCGSTFTNVIARDDQPKASEMREAKCANRHLLILRASQPSQLGSSSLLSSPQHIASKFLKPQKQINYLLLLLLLEFQSTQEIFTLLVPAMCNCSYNAEPPSEGSQFSLGRQTWVLVLLDVRQKSSKIKAFQRSLNWFVVWFLVDTR